VVKPVVAQVLEVVEQMVAAVAARYLVQQELQQLMVAREALVHTVQAVADFLQMVVQIATVQRQ
jgi:hypothetical protein